MTETSPRHRPAARVLCLDPGGRVLLLRWRDPGDGSIYWEPPGGGLEPGESPIDAARRELTEETGLPAHVVLEHNIVAQRDFWWNGRHFRGPETFFLGHVAAAEIPGAAGLTGDEDGALLGYGWFSRDELAALSEPLEPPVLAELLDQLVDRSPVSPATPATPAFLELADPAFSVTSDQVYQARQASWYADTSYGIAVLRHREASELISHPQLRQGSSAWPAHHGITSGPFASWWANWVLNKEGADHRRLRKLMNPAFSRRLVEAARPRFRALATELVDSFADAGRCEFMADFAEPYAARAIAYMLGVPESEWPAIARDSATLGLATGVTIRENLNRIEAALARLHAYADALIADRRATPRDDCVTSLVTAHDEGDRLTGDELRDTLVLLIFGGFDTTRNQLGLAMRTFTDHPDQWRLLAQRPELAPAAVEEVMRVNPTTTWVTREAVDDFTFNGLAIKAGTTIHLLCEPAGTDPLASQNVRFDIAGSDRPPHLAFGGGIHYCLGHLVARADMSEALAVLASRISDPRVSGEAVWLPCSGNTGPIRLPLSFGDR